MVDPRNTLSRIAHLPLMAHSRSQGIQRLASASVSHGLTRSIGSFNDIHPASTYPTPNSKYTPYIPLGQSTEPQYANASEFDSPRGSISRSPHSPQPSYELSSTDSPPPPQLMLSQHSQPTLGERSDGVPIQLEMPKG